jgi:hypothetical protein
MTAEVAIAMRKYGLKVLKFDRIFISIFLITRVKFIFF